jgi:DNA-3-methyladenine glycosylase II
MDAIKQLTKSDPRLAKVIATVGLLEYNITPQRIDSFTFLVREIVGQVISSNSKRLIWGRLVELCGYVISPVTVSSLTTEQLRGIGLSYSKCSYILNLATRVLEGEIRFDTLNSLPDEKVVNYLVSIKGIGYWTSKMYLIFFLGREDVLPYEDGAFLQAYKWLYNTKNIKPDSIKRKCKKWKPYTSIGARYMYRALDMGLTKIPIKVFLGNN